MRIGLRPAEIEIAEGVPAGEARTLITTFAMIVMGVTGITAAGVTLYVAPAASVAWFFSLAVAEMALALIVILLIARQAKVVRGPVLIDVTTEATAEKLS
jgi:hypothetical protein